VADVLTADGELTYASFPIEKVEETADGNVLVWGKATDDSVDSDDQIVDPEFAAKAIDDWMATGPNVRVQHQPQRDPAGVGISVERDGNSHWVKSKIIEPVAKQLVLGGALRAYSVGIARPTIQRDVRARGGRITDGQIVEISLVDRPANKNCGIQLVKAAKNGTPMFTGKVFGADDVLTKSADDVTITLPQDVQVSFSPLDMAKILARRNGASKDVTTTYHGGVPGGSVPKADDEEEVEKDVTTRYEGGVPAGSKADGEGHDMCKCLACKSAGITKRKLTTEARSALPDSDFVFPEERRYPIHDKNHARNALARVSQHGTPEEKAKVRAAVHRRYPDIGQEKKPSKKKAAKAAASVAQEALADLTKKSLEKKDKAACMACGAMQNKAHGYCSECGTKMDSAMPVEKNHDFMCLKCGYKLDKGEKHCPGCGSENPGYNPMADLKIPANKMLLMKAAGEDRVPVTKAKKNGKGKQPFGGKQAPPFGKDKDDDGGSAEKGKKKKGKVPPVMASEEAAEKGGFGHTPSPGEGVTGEHTQSVPRHREPDGPAVEAFEHDSGLPTNGDASKCDTTAPSGIAADMHAMPAASGRGKRKKKSKPSMPTPPGAHGAQGAPGSSMGPPDEEFDRMAGKSADPEIAVTMRLKSLGVDAGMGFLHDLTCPAYKYEDVMKAYPTGLERFSADEWQAKALSAAASAPLAEAQAASQLGQHAFTIKSADVNDLHDVKNDIHKAFRDANPGPSSFPTPGHISAQQFQRPHITTGLAAYSHQYDGPNSGHVPSEGGIAASGFTRGNIGGTASQSPAQKGAPYPSETGSPVNLNYSSVHKQNLMQAFKAMHDHFDRIMPSGVCPMNAPASGPAAHTFDPAEKGAPEPAVAKKVSADGMTKKARKRRDKKLVRAVMKGKMPLDEARIKMGKKPKKSPEPLNPSKSAEPDVTKATTGDPDRFTVVMKSELAAALRRAEKKNARKLKVLTRAVNSMAGQPDPATQAFKGMALNPVRTKAASPAGVASIAENAERTQMMILRELESEARNSPYPERREAAWNAVLKMKGLSDLG
jgi:hypothetical protein